MQSCFVRSVGLLFGAFTAAGAQLVTPKTVPIRQDEQFAIVPSARAGMGGVSIALDDSLADVFSNPARALFGRGTTTFAAPYTHSVTGGHGGGQTLPMGMIASRGDWSVAFVGAVQNLDHNKSSNPLNAGWLNRYGQGSVARRFSNDLVIGAEASVSRLNAMDGLDVMYDGSDAIAEIGTATDFRLGATKRWGGSRLDLVVLNANNNMMHAVSSSGEYYDYGAQAMFETSEVDHNLDRTHVWGAHTQFAQDLGDGWRAGWLATANHLTHPKIPDYNVKETPFVRWDPGATDAFNFGVGLGHASRLVTFGVDFIQEPMSSHTWGEDRTVNTGAHTVDNYFKFSNSKFRIGYSRDWIVNGDSTSLIGFQLGYERYAIGYRLNQDDHVTGGTRTAFEGWTEHTPTFGFHVRAGAATVRYNYRLTCSRDCLPSLSGDKVTIPPAISTSVIAAPLSAVQVDGGTSRFHQLIVSVAVR